MKLKSYLRGIGCGMIVAALVMGATMQRTSKEVPEDKSTILQTASSISSSVSSPGETSISKEDTKEPEDTDDVNKESDNGETEDSRDASDDKITKDSSSEETESNNITVENQDTVNDEKTDEATDTYSDEENGESEDKNPGSINPLEKGDKGYTESEESVVIKIVKGDTSVSVARRLFEAGLVDSAVSFDKYLCKNGYDKKISVGTFTIKRGSDNETIAKTISRKK